MDEKTLDLNFIICAQPKSGSTWLVHLLSSLIDDKYTFDQLEKYIPITKTSRIPYRVHNIPNINIKKIILIRNPFDSIISWKNYCRLRNTSFSGATFLNNFYKSVDATKGLIVRYEDLKEKPVHELYKIVNYLNWNIPIEKLIFVINKCSLKNLKEYEDKKLEKDGKFLFYDPKQQITNNVRFYNRGNTYAFHKDMTKSDIEETYNKYKTYIHKYWPELREVV